MSKLTAKLPLKCSSNARNYYGEKELVSSYQVVAYSKGEFKNPVTVKCYMGRSSSASVVYASIWINAPKKELYCSGRGNAGGYGYHKESAAIDSAIRSAGVTLNGPIFPSDSPGKKNTSIAGVGDSAIREALEAIARACGYRKFTIV